MGWRGGGRYDGLEESGSLFGVAPWALLNTATIGLSGSTQWD